MAKTELEEAGESTDGMASSTASLRAEIKALSGVDIMLDSKNFKSTYQVMDELSAKWEDLSDIAQASITELLAGKHQGNVMASLMTNFDIARDTLETSLNSSGSAMKEHAKWSESLEAKLLKLKATWQSLSQSFLQSDFLKGALDAIIGLVNALDWLIDKVGLLPTAIGAFAAFKSFSGDGIFKTIKDEATGAATGITSIFKKAASESSKAISSIGLNGNSIFKDGIKADITALGNYKKAIKDGMSKANAFSTHMKNASASFQEFVRSGKHATVGVSAFIKQQQAAEISTLAQNKSLSNANAIIKEYFSGCKNVGIGQIEFAEAVNKTNPALGKQLTSAKSAKGALGGYAISLAGATIKTIALEAATMALNAALTMGISALITWAVQAIDKLIVTSSELAEQVEEVTESYKSQHEELMKLKGDYDTSDEDSMISKYGKLSKGVNALGENVSLTADEYSEYQSIVNKIADQIPSLVSGFDSQGNAILSCGDNVDVLIEKYEALIKAQNDSVLGEYGDVEDDFKNKVDYNNKSANWLGFDQRVSYEDAAKFKELLNAKDIESAWSEVENTIDMSSAYAMSKLLENSGFEKTNWLESEYTHIERALKEDRVTVQRILDNYYSGIEEDAASMKQAAQAVLSNAFDISKSDYYDMSDTMKNVARQIVNGFDYEFYAEEIIGKDVSIETYINNMLDKLKAIGDTESASIEAAFNFKTQFNGGEVSYGEYVKNIREASKLIDGLDLDDDVKSQIKLALNTDDIIKEYDALVNRLKTENIGLSDDEAKKFVDGLSAEEYSILMSIIPEISDSEAKETVSEIQAMIDRELAMQGLTLDLDINVEKTKLEALTTALSESVSGTGLSTESLAAVEGMFSGLSSYDPSKLFERSANGIRLNNDELRRLNSEYKKTNVAKVNKEMDTLGDIYNQTREELYNLEYGTDEYNDKLSDLKDVEAKINANEKLLASYQGLTSSYQEWQMAESAGSQRDMYETVLSGWETVGDEISRGWYDDGTIEFLELLKGEKATIIDGNGNKKEIDIATASAKELKQVWKDLDNTITHTTYSVRDFFTVDEDGNSTSQGVYNFLDAIGQMEEEKFNGKDVVQRDEKGRIIGFDFQMVGGDKVIAEALGVSEELVQIMKRAADDAGFVVSLDGTYQQLDVLKEKAQTAAESLNKTLEESGKKGFDFNFNTNDVEDIKKQLTEAGKILDGFRNADGTVNMELEGADEALTVASTLQSMLDKLTRPTYMEIETSEVEKDIQEPLKNLQELRTLTEQEHQLKLSGGDTTELEKSKQEIYDYFENLDPEIKTEIGLVDDKGNPLTGDALKKKLESGDLSIEATVDLQMEMDEKLGVLVDKALYDAGIIDEEEFNKRVKIYLEGDVDTSEVDNDVKDAKEKIKEKITENVKTPYSEETVEVAVDFLANTEEVDSYTPDQLNAIVEFIAETDNVDKYTPKQKEALVTFFAETKEPDTYTPEQKKAIVDYLAGTKSIDEYTPEEKEAIARFIKNSTDPDKYQPDPKTGKVTFDKDSSIPDGYNAPNPTGTVTFIKNSTDVDTYNPPNFDRYVRYYAKKMFTNGAEAGEKALENRGLRTGGGSRGRGGVNGTANANGTAGRAYKQGSWGTKGSGTALVGELGRETLVRGGHYYTIGDDGAEFIKYQRGDIIFNHKQTEELFKNGKVTSDGGRAKAFVDGTAFDTGTNYNGTTKRSYAVGENDKDKTQETFDWIEVLISRLERTIDNLDQDVNNIYKSWNARNTALTEEIAKVGNLITQQNNAKTKYQQAANDVGLDQKYIDLIQSGKIDFSTIEDELIIEKIQDYQKWYEKALACDDAIQDLYETEAKLYAQRFDNISSEYDGILQGYEHTESMLNEYISQAEAQGHIVSKKYYQALIDNEKDSIAQLKKEQADLIAKRDEAVSSGAIEKGSQAW